MKKWKLAKLPTMVLDSVTCDDCGAECKNSHFDVLIKMSFCEEPTLVKTICWDCYDKQFKEAIINARKI